MGDTPFMPSDDETEAELLDRITFVSQLHALPDFLLSGFIENVNEAGIELELTLMVGGSLICGSAISQPAYIDLLLKQYGATADQLEDNVWESLKVSPSAEPTDERSPAYVHLRDVRMLQGGTWVNAGVFRLRIAHVEGWTFGRFKRDE